MRHFFEKIFEKMRLPFICRGERPDFQAVYSANRVKAPNCPQIITIGASREEHRSGVI